TGDTRRFGTNFGREMVAVRAGICAVGVGRRVVDVCPCATDGVVIAPPSVPDDDTLDIVSRLKARSRADWKRRSRDFSRQRRTSRSRAGGMFGSVSVRSGGSSLRIALSVSIDESRLNARVPL